MIYFICEKSLNTCVIFQNYYIEFQNIINILGICKKKVINFNFIDLTVGLLTTGRELIIAYKFAIHLFHF